MLGLIEMSLAILAGILIQRYHREILAALKRFDDRNRARIEGEARDKADSLAHYRHTLTLAEEQVEEVSEVTLSDPRTATPLTRYVFEGEHFTTRREAERVREEKVRAKARAFYMELPLALSARGDDRLH
ncbi:MAG: hypothetical protein KGR48_16790 [Alphaproteobacteria bacterium]|nr:hypothetical protein [Alphaproteobacteria bacterium]MDE2014578.1 hypothetical protein [Alphaproteobacteria bacterium]MDE2075344.1 hypothetical protein [Alphaproteobacteria bacterium]MDE2350283.1 hypothetical protein [Alphaproteobacteria bacterium]